MDHFQEYLATEVALDHAHGQLSRREALRRMGMMGLSLTAASALLAACADDGDEDTTGSGAQATTTPARQETTPVTPEDVTYPGPNGTLMGAYAAASSPKGAVVVVHENRGLVDTTKAVAGRLAGDGFSALAVDLLSEEGGTARVPAADVGATLRNAGPARIREDLVATIDEILRRNPSAKAGMIGFCFGGAVVWDFLTIEEPRLLAAAPFYGTTPDDPVFRTKAAVFAVYAENDARVNATRDTARAALERADLTHVIKTYPGVGHAFYNDVQSPQSMEAYGDALTWFDRHLS